jgi:hypothetical protein
MVVANIHRSLAYRGVTTDQLADLLAAARALRDTHDDEGDIVAQNYLSQLRAVYGSGYRCWEVFDHVRGVLELAQLDESYMVFTNAAKCQLGTDADAGVQRKLVNACLRTRDDTYGLAALVAKMKPLAIIFLSAPARDEVLKAGPGVPLISVHQWANRKGRLLTPVHIPPASEPLGTGTDKDAWQAQLADYLRHQF